MVLTFCPKGSWAELLWQQHIIMLGGSESRHLILIPQMAASSPLASEFCTWWSNKLSCSVTDQSLVSYKSFTGSRSLLCQSRKSLSQSCKPENKAPVSAGSNDIAQQRGQVVFRQGSSGHNFASKGQFHNVWRYLWLSRLACVLLTSRGWSPEVACNVQDGPTTENDLAPRSAAPRVRHLL